MAKHCAEHATCSECSHQLHDVPFIIPVLQIKNLKLLMWSNIGSHRARDGWATNTSLGTLSKSTELIKSKSGLEGRILTRSKILGLFHSITLLGQFSMGYQICLLFHFWASLMAQLVKNLRTRPGFNSWVGKIPWRRERLPTPVFWPGDIPRTV